ncbi:MAG TPA: tetratricopeptide repeat protein [Terracidiphilus sp.]
MRTDRRLVWRAGVSALLVTAGTLFAAQAANPASEGLRKADAAFRAGYAASQQGHYEEARARFSEVVKLAPQIAEGHEALGSAFIALDRPAEAVPELEKAVQLKPDDAVIEGNLAIALWRAADGTKAIPHFEAALRLGVSPQDPAFLDAYARALAGAGRREDALKQFAAEEQITGPRAEIEDAIGTVHAQMGQWDEARAAFERALRENSAFVQARVHLGAVHRQQHDLNAAIAVLEPAAKADPPDAAALAEYGRALADAGQDEAAAAALQQAVTLRPNLAGVAGDLAMTLQRLGRQQEAIPWFEKAIAVEPTNASMLANLGLALTITGKAKAALPYIDRAQAAAPNDATVVKDRGVAHVQLAAFDDAIEDFKAALVLDPSDPQLHYDLGLAYKLKDRMDEAVVELARAGEMDPQLEDPPYTLGILYMQLGKMDEAVTQLRKAVLLRPDNGSAWALLGSTLKQAERLPEAKEALEKAIALQPGQPGSMVTLAGVLSEMAAKLGPEAEAAESGGDQAKAEQLRAEMKALRAQAAGYRKEGAELSQAAVNRQRASFLLNAGNQLLLKGQIADAIGRYQESIAADGTFAEPHSQLAQAYDRQGRVQEAAAERAKAADLGGQK